MADVGGFEDCGLIDNIMNPDAPFTDFTRQYFRLGAGLNRDQFEEQRGQAFTDEEWEWLMGADNVSESDSRAAALFIRSPKGHAWFLQNFSQKQRDMITSRLSIMAKTTLPTPLPDKTNAS